MTATCRESCCSVTPRVTVSELFERGYRRMRLEPLHQMGDCVCDAEGNTARFSLAMDGDKVVDVNFRASPCTTLIAYCEWISESMPGFASGIASALTARELTTSVPGVPALKQERAVLAIAAFRAALRAARETHIIQHKEPSK